MLRFVGYVIAACAGLALMAAAAQRAAACTGIRIQAEDGSVVYARTLEFGLNFDSQILFLPQGYEFVGTTASGKPGLRWTSKFAAVGLNGLNEKLLVDGVNEHGLGVGGFYLPGYAGYQTVTADDVSRSIAPWEVITWILTNFTNVDEVRAALPGIKVAAVDFAKHGGVPPLHYIAHDAAGHSLVIEYVDGKLHTYENPVGVITNSPTFDWHVTNLSNFVNLSATNVPPIDLHGIKLAPFGQGSGMRGLPGDFTPPSRFVRAVALSQSAFAGKNAEETVNEAFHILDSFDIPKGVIRPDAGSREPFEFTQWTCASDLANRKFYFHTYGNRRVRMVELSRFDHDANGPVILPIADNDAIEDLSPEATVE